MSVCMYVSSAQMSTSQTTLVIWGCIGCMTMTSLAICDLWLVEEASRQAHTPQYAHTGHTTWPLWVGLQAAIIWPKKTLKKNQADSWRQCPVIRWLQGVAAGSHRREIKRWRTAGMPRTTDVAATSQLGCRATALFPRISGSGKTPHGFAEVECWFQTSGYLPRIPPSPMLAVDSRDVERQLKIVLVDIEWKEPGGTQSVKSLDTL